MDYDFVLADVFSAHAFGGNQLAVLPDARGLTPPQMQAIAREFNFAETAFVLPAEDERHTHRLRIFSPGEEMPFAGHPTVGTAAVLAHLEGQGDRKVRFVFGEPVGAVPAQVDLSGGRLYSGLILPATLDEPLDAPKLDRYADVLSLPVDAVEDAWFGSVGLRFAFAQLAHDADVDGAILDRTAWTEGFADNWASKLFFFAGTLIDGGTVYARMFAPGIGVDEDPATGSACAALIARLAVNDPRPDARITLDIVQGQKMGRRSDITARAVKEHGELVHATVAGDVTIIGHGKLSVPREGHDDGQDQ